MGKLPGPLNTRGSSTRPKIDSPRHQIMVLPKAIVTLCGGSYEVQRIPVGYTAQIHAA